MRNTLAVLVAGEPVKIGGKLVDDALAAKACRLATESRDYLFEKAEFSRN